MNRNSQSFKEEQKMKSARETQSAHLDPDSEALPGLRDMKEWIKHHKSWPFIVVVFGGTGTGKTTFVNKASGGSFAVGTGLESCTATPFATQPFSLGHGFKPGVFLIDTPGFDDTTRSDAETVSVIVKALSALYKATNILVSGILYFHRITDVRMSGSSARNLRILEKLCGPEKLPHVLIVTTHWDEVDQGIAANREKELRDRYFEPVLSKGTQMVRLKPDTPENAQTILKQLARQVFNSWTSAPLRIQHELIFERKKLVETDAGREIAQELRQQIGRKEKESGQLLIEINDARRENDEQVCDMLSGERVMLEAKGTRLTEELARLSMYDDACSAISTPALSPRPVVQRLSFLQASVNGAASIRKLPFRRAIPNLRRFQRTTQRAGCHPRTGATAS
ncbi:hypothetical protein V5O48_008509 [Marasmius crinis-equi]|uniref:G domain-containing protein n=1 Tax=Marasmius crinis-equi TaxID=585013 RepID=A0ABR3FDY3_9AGAR